MRVSSTVFASCHRALVALVLVMTAAFVGIAQAQDYVAGQHYKVLTTPVPVTDPSRIEVVEIFWYGCPHCRDFNPMIKAWAKTLPEDVNLELLPVSTAKDSKIKVHAMAFFASQALGVQDDVHQALFDAIARDKRPLNSESAMIEFLAGLGVDKARLEKAFASSGLRARSESAFKRVQAFQAPGVPALIVNGKYRIDAGDAGGFSGMLAVADFLIAQERAAMAAAR